MFVVAAFIAAISVFMLASAHEEASKNHLHDTYPTAIETSNDTPPLDISPDASHKEVEPVEEATVAVEALEAEVVAEPEPRFFEIPMNMNDDVRSRVECANGKVSSCEGVRTRSLPSN